MTDTDGVVKLAPCPFCGSEPILDTAQLVRNVYYWVRCQNNECRVLPSAMQCLNRAQAIEAWNTRSTASGDGEALRIAREELATAEREGLCEGCTVAARQIVKRLAALTPASEE